LYSTIIAEGGFFHKISVTQHKCDPNCETANSITNLAMLHLGQHRS